MKFLYLLLFLAILPGANAQVSDSEMPQILKEEGPDWCPFIATYLGTEVIIPPNHKFLSPDHNFVFCIVKQKRLYQYSLEITDKTTGLKSSFVDSFYPVLQEAWSSDSKNLLLVEHVAQGSTAIVIHLDGKKWIYIETDVPYLGINDNVHVITWQFRPDYIFATFIVNHILPSNHSYHDSEFYKATCHVNLETGRISHTHYIRLTLDEFRALRTPRN